MILNSWKEISNYVGRGVRTIQRWESDMRFPVHRTGEHLRSSVYALSEEIDAWLKHRGNARPSAHEERHLSIKAMRKGMDQLAAHKQKLMDRSHTLKTLTDTMHERLQTTSGLHSKIREARRLRNTG